MRINPLRDYCPARFSLAAAPAPDSECAQICKKTYGPNAACGEKSGGNTASVQPSAGGKKAYKCACADATFWIPPSKGSEPVQCRYGGGGRVE